MTNDRVQQCAATLMDTFHFMMRTIGAEMRKRPPEVLSFHQFRVLKAIQEHKGASLSQVAERLGDSLSAASKLVDSLVEQGFVARSTAEDDRRKLALEVTDAGREAMNVVHRQALSLLSEKLASLSLSECAMLDLAMDILRSKLGSVEQSDHRGGI